MPAQIEAVSAVRHALWQHGFRPLAVLSQDKIPLGREWQLRARQDPPECVRFDPVAHALNTGILCDGLRAIDCDIDDPDIAEQVITTIEQSLGLAPIRSRPDSPRRLFIYRAATGQPGKRTLAGSLGKIEVLGRGQQFVAFGTHPSGAELQWRDESPCYVSAAELPSVTEDQITTLFTALAPIVGAEAPDDAPEPAADGGNGQDRETELEAADHATVIAALLAIPNGPGQFDDWNAWNNVGMALWTATAGSEEGWKAFDQWSANHPSYDADRVRERWKDYATSPPSRIGAGTIYHLAVQAGWTRPTRPQPFSMFQEQGQERAQEDRKNILSIDDLMELADPDWLLHGIIPEHGLTVFYGPPKAGKSFITLSLALHVAASRPWFDRTVKSGAVVYIAGEGVGGLKNRVKAMIQAYDLPSTIPFWIIPRAVNFRSEAEVKALASLVRTTVGEAPIRWVIIDTLARAMPGADENSAQDVGLVIAACDWLKAELNCAVSPVHHEGKDESKGARGSSALRGAWDAAARITGTGKQTTLEVTDQKDAEAGEILTFEMREVPISPSRSSLVPFLKDNTERPEAPRGRPTGRPGILFAIVQRLAQGIEAQNGAASVFLVRREFYHSQPDLDLDAKQKAFRRALDTLIQKNRIVVRHEWITPIF